MGKEISLEGFRIRVTNNGLSFECRSGNKRRRIGRIPSSGRADDCFIRDGDIGDNAAVAANTADIATNASAITTNASAITTNASAITTNAEDIATNTADIDTNADDIATNVGDIATNAEDIDTNETAIALNTAHSVIAGATNRTVIHHTHPSPGTAIDDVATPEGEDVDTTCRNKVNEIISALEAYGIINT